MMTSAKNISKQCGLERSTPESIVVRLSPKELTVAPEQVSRYAGGTRYRLDPQRQALVDFVLKRAQELIDLAFVYCAHSLDSLLPNGLAQLDCGLSFPLPGNQQDTGARCLAFCVCTIGGRLEEAVRTLMSSGKLLDALFLDAAGTAFLDALSEKGCEALEEEARKRGLHAGCSAGPGYGEFDLSWQRQLFALVDASAIGVRINDSCVMEPAKSLSFFMQWTTSPPHRASRNKCASCTMIHCPYRV
jgi:hypothetical protein